MATIKLWFKVTLDEAGEAFIIKRSANADNIVDEPDDFVMGLISGTNPPGIYQLDIEINSTCLYEVP